MKVLKFYSYIFYRLKRYYDYWQAVLVFNVILISHYFSIVLYFASINRLKAKDILFLSYTNNYFDDRLKIAIFYLLPVFVITYTISRIKKKRIEIYYQEFEEYKRETQKRLNFYVLVYYALSAIFFISALLSPLFFRKW
jgi:hypothetical protein